MREVALQGRVGRAYLKMRGGEKKGDAPAQLAGWGLHRMGSVNSADGVRTRRR